MTLKKRVPFILLVISISAGALIMSSISSGSGSQKKGFVSLSKLSRKELASLSRVSADGTPFTLPASDPRTQDLVAQGIGPFSLLGSDGARNFFRAENSNGTACYAAGPTGPVAWPLGIVVCPKATNPFPSSRRPVLDFSVVGSTTTNPEMSYERLQGVATDGVSEIQGIGKGGAVLVSVPVKNNLYFTDNVPAGVTQLRALDASGNVVYNVGP